MRQDGLGSLIVECDQEVIEDEWHWLVLLQMTIKRCKPECEIKLIPGPVAHFFDKNIRPTHPPASHDWDVLVGELRRETVKGASRYRLEHQPGPFEEWALIFLSELFDLGLEEVGGKSQTHEPGSVLPQGRRLGFSLLSEIRRCVSSLLHLFPLPV